MTLSGTQQFDSPEICAAAIRRAQNVLVIGHVDPDGDAIGSMLGMGWLLQELGISHVLACDTAVSNEWDFLPRTGPVVARCADDHDLVITVDCNALDRLGRFCSRPQLVGLPLVNIDHHVTNTLFGQINWVDGKAAATSEMIYGLAVSLGLKVSREAATCLLAGIVTDTFGFRTPNTTARTLEIALHMMQAGASLSDIVARTLDSRGFASMCLWARVISQVRLMDGVLWADAKLSDFEKCGADREARKGLINFLITVKEANIAILLTETHDGTIDVSMRSIPGLDVSAVAVRLGGGGHPQAAGCTLTGSMDEARASIDAALKSSLTDQGLGWPGVKTMLS